MPNAGPNEQFLIEEDDGVDTFWIEPWTQFTDEPTSCWKLPLRLVGHRLFFQHRYIEQATCRCGFWKINPLSIIS